MWPTSRTKQRLPSDNNAEAWWQLIKENLQTSWRDNFSQHGSIHARPLEMYHYPKQRQPLKKKKPIIEHDKKLKAKAAGCLSTCQECERRKSRRSNILQSDDPSSVYTWVDRFFCNGWVSWCTSKTNWNSRKKTLQDGVTGKRCSTSASSKETLLLTLNISGKTDIVFFIWKEEDIIPIFNSEDKKDPCSYRSISRLSFLGNRED